VGAPDPRAPGPQGRDLTEPTLDVVARIEASLAAAGFTITRDSVAGRQAVIAGPRGFWPGRRQLFVLVTRFKAGMTGRQHLDRYLDEAGQYAATVKGGLTAGSAVAVAVVEAGGASAAGDWASRPVAPATATRRAAAFPVLVDLATGHVTCPDAPVGLRRLVADHVTPAV
jgi:hypothetical protein